MEYIWLKDIESNLLDFMSSLKKEQFSFYPVKNYDHYESKPIYSFKSLDKFIHQVWAINQNKNLENLIKKIKKIYVCDGHHRLQGMIKNKKKISSMIVAFPHNQIQILFL